MPPLFSLTAGKDQVLPLKISQHRVGLYRSGAPADQQKILKFRRRGAKFRLGIRRRAAGGAGFSVNVRPLGKGCGPERFSACSGDTSQSPARISGNGFIVVTLTRSPKSSHSIRAAALSREILEVIRAWKSISVTNDDAWVFPSKPARLLLGEITSGVGGSARLHHEWRLESLTKFVKKLGRTDTRQSAITSACDMIEDLTAWRPIISQPRSPIFGRRNLLVFRFKPPGIGFQKNIVSVPARASSSDARMAYSMRPVC